MMMGQWILEIPSWLPQAMFSRGTCGRLHPLPFPSHISICFPFSDHQHGHHHHHRHSRAHWNCIYLDRRCMPIFLPSLCVSLFSYEDGERIAVACGQIRLHHSSMRLSVCIRLSGKPRHTMPICPQVPGAQFGQVLPSTRVLINFAWAVVNWVFRESWVSFTSAWIGPIQDWQDESGSLWPCKGRRNKIGDSVS